MLKAGTPNAIASGQKIYVDPIPTSGTDNGIYVPASFIEEHFVGAKVSVNGTEATVLYEGKQTSLTADSNGMLPICAFARAIGKNVITDAERGLVIITEEGITYSDTVINKMADELSVRVFANDTELTFFELERTEYVLDVESIETTVPQIRVEGAEAEIVQAEKIGTYGVSDAADTATISINGITYSIKIQVDPFEGILNNRDDGVLDSLKATLDTLLVPEEYTYIYVEDVTASSFSTSSGGSYPVRGVVDGVISSDVEHRWGAKGTDGSCWIQVDFGSVQTLHSMAFAGSSHDVRAYKFDVLVSEDGTNWTTIHTGGTAATTELMAVIDFNGTDTDIQARYVKLVGYGYTDVNGLTGEWNNYAELRFYESEEQQSEDMEYWEVYFNTEGFVGEVGSTANIILTGLDFSKNEFELKADAVITYDVADNTIATVDAAGKISFLKEGSTTITITAVQDGFSASTTENIVCTARTEDEQDPGEEDTDEEDTDEEDPEGGDPDDDNDAEKKDIVFLDTGFESVKAGGKPSVNTTNPGIEDWSAIVEAKSKQDEKNRKYLVEGAQDPTDNNNMVLKMYSDDTVTEEGTSATPRIARNIDLTDLTGLTIEFKVYDGGSGSPNLMYYTTGSNKIYDLKLWDGSGTQYAKWSTVKAEITLYTENSFTYMSCNVYVDGVPKTVKYDITEASLSAGQFRIQSALTKDQSIYYDDVMIYVDNTPDE